MDPLDKIDKRYLPTANLADLQYFLQLQEARLPEAPDVSMRKWNQRAEFWQKERANRRKGDGRVQSAVQLLRQRGILNDSYDVVDIGCGPGRFVAAFAKVSRSVLGLDISEKMVAHGMEHIRKQGLNNASLRACDFQALDIEKEGYKAAFDLAFSSMTPAVHGVEGIVKQMEMSRAWCCSVTHLSGRNRLRQQITREVFGREMPLQWSGRWFYALFNILFLMGYNPETSYDTRRQQVFVEADDEYTAFMMEHMLPEEERNRENAAKILAWLQAHADGDGRLQEITDSCYATVLWDVRDKSERPDYGIVEKGIL
ncbi:MAG: class I SAM-dependent methyltransferase [Firmicutes bacterium]|nr:class I SAM-dependent methyltransferase [Bacillota bacterium]